MVIVSDLQLRGKQWHQAIEVLSPMLEPRPNYYLFLFATAIGILYDRRIERGDDDESMPPANVPRNVFNSNSEPFDELFQAAIITTTTESLEDEKRLDLAFGEGDANFNKTTFLLQFANYGITKIVDLIALDKVETIENIKNFLITTMEDSNFDINSLPDEIMVNEDDLSIE